MSTLASGGTLQLGQGIASPNDRYRLELRETDGNLVLTGPSGIVWSAETWNTGVVRADMRTDGNLVLHTAGGDIVWASGTGGRPGAYLAVQNDRNIVVYASDRVTVLWSPNTYLSAAERATAAART